MELIIFDALPFLNCPTGYVAEAMPGTIDIPAGLLDVTLWSRWLLVFLRLLLIAVNHLLTGELKILSPVMIFLILISFHFFPIQL